MANYGYTLWRYPARSLIQLYHVVRRLLRPTFVVDILITRHGPGIGPVRQAKLCDHKTHMRCSLRRFLVPIGTVNRNCRSYFSRQTMTLQALSDDQRKAVRRYYCITHRKTHDQRAVTPWFEQTYHRTKQPTPRVEDPPQRIRLPRSAEKK
jgi:hypothetical protein